MDVNSAAAIALQAQKATPVGKLTGVSVPDDVNGQIGGPMAALLSFGRGLLNTAKGVFTEGTPLVPGSSIALSVTKNASEAAANTTAALKDATGSVSAGIKQGTSWAFFVIVLFVGLWIWSIVKPRS